MLDNFNMPQHVESVRGFNRFYTRQIGLLRKGYLGSPFSLAEVRVLYELAHRKRPVASEIALDLDMDAGYLSRLLAGFETRGLVTRSASPADARQSHLALTKRGRNAFLPLEAKSRKEIAALLHRLSTQDQARLVHAMQTIESLLDPKPSEYAPLRLRAHRPGDMGWVVHLHGALYAAEYGWNERFEALVAGIVAKFIENFDPQRERCWIAERSGVNVGSIFLVKKSATVAKLRLLLVDPSARGQGLGKRLIDECIQFARAAGYRKVELWTQSTLYAARHLYKTAGFELVRKSSLRDFGHTLTSETWELKL